MGNPSLLFKGQMIQALRNAQPGVWPAVAIDGERPYKWQTRRVIAKQPLENTTPILSVDPTWQGWEFVDRDCVVQSRPNCPYGRADDVAWVRETWATLAQWDSARPSDLPVNGVPIYYKDDGFGGYKKRPSIFMPRWASRDDLLIKWIRVERLRDISEADAKAEGVGPWNSMFDGEVYRPAFSVLWDGINGWPKLRKTNPYTGRKEECYASYPWADEQGTEQYRGLVHYVIGNPWVWAIAFMRMARSNGNNGG